MKRLFLVLILLTSVAAIGGVVRMAPNFGLEGTGQRATLRAFAGNPVVLIVARSARENKVKSQLKRLQELYPEFASKKVLFVAAFQDPTESIHTDIPFVLAKDGVKVAADYGVTEPFQIMVIGKDGNIDLQTAKVCPASRVRDVLINSYVVQSASRK